MAGHSKFKNIQHRKGAQDKKRAKIFTRLIKELSVAARASTDPASNPRLRSALAAARAANMPKDNIDRVLNEIGQHPRFVLISLDLGVHWQRQVLSVSCLIKWDKLFIQNL